MGALLGWFMATPVAAWLGRIAATMAVVAGLLLSAKRAGRKEAIVQRDHEVAKEAADAYRRMVEAGHARPRTRDELIDRLRKQGL